jgi:hypothetical protein
MVIFLTQNTFERAIFHSEMQYHCQGGEKLPHQSHKIWKPEEPISYFRLFVVATHGVDFRRD